MFHLHYTSLLNSDGGDVGCLIHPCHGPVKNQNTINNQ